MVYERNLEPSENTCADCGDQLELDKQSDQYVCRSCGELKPPGKVE